MTPTTMPSPDLINGLFEIWGGFFIGLSCRRLYKDKSVRGVSPWHAFYFTTWGFWNLYFYPHVGATWSFYGGVLVAIVNAVWLGMLVYYGRKNS